MAAKKKEIKTLSVSDLGVDSDFLDPKNKALKEIDIKVKEHMKDKTGDILPNIPGFDMGNLFKWQIQKKELQ